MGPFTGHARAVLCVAISPDGQWIASSSGDQTVRLWNVSTQVATGAGSLIEMGSVLEPVEFPSDGQFIISSEPQVNLHVMLNTVTGNATGNTVTASHAEFTDHSIINEDGWICGSNGELLIWIPLMHRAHLHRPSNIWVGGKYETRMDLSGFVHGHRWATCIDPR